MQAKTINRLSGRVPWWLAVGLALCAALTVASPAAGATGADRPAAGLVHGWKAGPVASGTGFRTTGGSSRVREVQRRLDRLGYAPGPIDGLFGPLTDSAVRRYQSDRELTADGIVGSKTIASLRARTETARDTRPAERPASRSRAGAATSATAASSPSSPARPQVGRPVSQSDGLEGLPSWWMLALIVPVAFSAAVVAGLLLVRMAGLAAAGAGAVRRSLRRRREPDWADHPAAGAIYVEGRSRDPGVGRFSGFAYWMWPVETASNGREEPTLLVYDPSKPGPVSARVEEITAVNGHAIETAIRPHVRRPDFKWVGARVLLAEQNGVDSLPGTLPVDLELFAENERERWEAGRSGRRRPVHVRLDDLEAGVEREVMSERLLDLAAALERRGVPMDVEELRRLPFAVELSLEVEYALAGKEVTHAEAG